MCTYYESNFYTKGYDPESRGLVQIREIYLILNETFEATDKDEEETNRQGNVKVEVRFQSLPWMYSLSNFEIC